MFSMRFLRWLHFFKTHPTTHLREQEITFNSHQPFKTKIPKTFRSTRIRIEESWILLLYQPELLFRKKLEFLYSLRCLRYPQWRENTLTSVTSPPNHIAQKMEGGKKTLEISLEYRNKSDTSKVPTVDWYINRAQIQAGE